MSSYPSVRTVRDAGETMIRGMTEALVHRMDPKAPISDLGRQHIHRSLIEMAREVLGSMGVAVSGMSRMQIAGAALASRAMTTGDFPNLLANVARRRMATAFAESAGTYDLWAVRAPDLPDFRDVKVVSAANMPDLLQVNEGGEFQYGSIGDAAESYRLGTYGRIVGLTRQAFVNDDLRVFDRALQAFAQSARRLENRLVYAQLTANAAMSDGVSLFHANHGNLQTGAGSALSLDALAAGRAAMRKQKGLQGEVLDLAPAWLIVPAALEQKAYQYTSAGYVPATSSAVNEFRQGGRSALIPVVEPLLDDASPTAWFLATRGGQMDTVEYAYLDGGDTPYTEVRPGFGVDGLDIKCRHDFACKAVEWRGLQKSTGS